MKPIVIGCLLVAPLLGRSEAPTLDTIWPPGGKQGSEFAVTLSGKLDPWPCDVLFSRKGFTFTPDAEKKGEGLLRVAPEVKPGPLLIRTANANGVSSPLIFLVDDREEILESEKDGNSISKAEPIDASKLPLVINGRLPANNEIDCFQISLEEGETIVAAVEGYSIRSLIDPVLHVYDEGGHRLQLEHDGAHHLDPLLTFRAPGKGSYVVAVTAFAHPPATSVFFRGQKNARYRLHLAWHRDQLPQRLLPQAIGKDSKPLNLATGTPGFGTLTKPNEKDEWTFQATKGQLLFVEVAGQRIGYPTDPVLRLLKPDGSELKLIDDSNKESDPEYLWKVAADGDYTLSVTDRFRRGSPEMRYRLTVDEARPSFAATLEKSEYVLEPGKELDLKITITRQHGHTGNLLFEISDLPDSVSVTPPEKVPDKGGAVTLKLKARENAAAFQEQITVQAWETDDEGKKTGQPQVVSFSFRDDGYRGPYAIMETTDLWLTIPPAKEKEKEKEKPEKADEKKN